MKALSILALALATTTAAVAEDVTTIAIGSPESTERTLTIQLGPVILSIVPFPARAPVTIEPGTKVKLISLAPGATYGPVRWFKDSTELAEKGANLEFTATAADSGNYYAIVKASPTSTTSTASVTLFVSTTGGQRLANMSSRFQLSPSQPAVISSFVIEPGPASTLVLVRAVGPALSAFGIKDGLATLRLRMLDAKGNVVLPANNQFLYPSLAEASRRVGAFPLPANSADVAQLYALPGGAFTAEVSADSGASGTVLLEVYQVPLTGGL